MVELLSKTMDRCSTLQLKTLHFPSLQILSSAAQMRTSSSFLSSKPASAPYGYVHILTLTDICKNKSMSSRFDLIKCTPWQHLQDNIWVNEVFVLLCWQTVVGTRMDSNAIGKLEKRLMEMEMKMHPMQNIWVGEVHFSNPLTEARKIAQELLNR